MKQSKNYSNSSKERKKNGKHGNDQKSYTRYDETTALSGTWSHRRETSLLQSSEEIEHTGN